MSIQWRKNGTSISGGTSERLTVSGITTADSGAYDAVITNAVGSIVSSTASLTVDAGHVKNISVRIVVPDNVVLIAGFVLDTPKSVLIRGVGRSLEQFGVAAGTTMANPRIVVYNAAGAIVAQNDDYIPSPSQNATMARVGAFAIASAQDAALLVALPAGAYTVQLNSVGGKGGDALVEVYDID
jgi:hypothetical protein